MNDIDAVLAANDDFYRAFNQRDMELMELTWAAAHDVTCLHPGWNLLDGRDDVLASWRGILENPNQARMVVGGAGVSFYGDVALVVCRELVGGSPLLATNVFVLEDGRWRLVHHHSGPVAQM